MWHPLLLLYWVIFYIIITYMINYFCWILMRWYFFTYIAFIPSFIIDTNNWIYISFFFQSNECIKGTFGINIDTRKVQIYYNIITVWCIRIIWFAAFDVWVNSSTSPLIRNVKIFLPCFLLDNINTITIYFNVVNISPNTIENKLLN